MGGFPAAFFDSAGSGGGGAERFCLPLLGSWREAMSHLPLLGPVKEAWKAGEPNHANPGPLARPSPGVPVSIIRSVRGLVKARELSHYRGFLPDVFVGFEGWFIDEARSAGEALPLVRSIFGCPLATLRAIHQVNGHGLFSPFDRFYKSDN